MINSLIIVGQLLFDIIICWLIHGLLSSVNEQRFDMRRKAMNEDKLLEINHKLCDLSNKHFELEKKICKFENIAYKKAATKSKKKDKK